MVNPKVMLSPSGSTFRTTEPVLASRTASRVGRASLSVIAKSLCNVTDASCSSSAATRALILLNIVAFKLTSVRVALSRFAPFKFAPVRFASFKFASFKSKS